MKHTAVEWQWVLYTAYRHSVRSGSAHLFVRYFKWALAKLSQ